MTWDLVISKYFIHWFYSENVMVLDKWYDDRGIYSLPQTLMTFLLDFTHVKSLGLILGVYL